MTASVLCRQANRERNNGLRSWRGPDYAKSVGRYAGESIDGEEVGRIVGGHRQSRTGAGQIGDGGCAYPRHAQVERAEDVYSRTGIDSLITGNDETDVLVEPASIWTNKCPGGEIGTHCQAAPGSDERLSLAERDVVDRRGGTGGDVDVDP